jgi:hypothetical protein
VKNAREAAASVHFARSPRTRGSFAPDAIRGVFTGPFEIVEIHESIDRGALDPQPLARLTDEVGRWCTPPS